MLEFISLLARANLVLAAAIILVLLLRAPTRRLFGARVAYALWLIPLLAAAMCFAPLRVVHIVLPAESIPASMPVSQLSHGGALAAGAAAPANLPLLLLLAWVGGAFIYLGVLALRQRRYLGALGTLEPRDDLGARVFAAQSAEHGPAVIGVWRPVIITPADFDRRFSAEEQRIVLAHERAHVAQGDPLINACMALLQCLNWFNPLVHVAARALRVDQELACDAAVLTRADSARRRYAEAILKTQIPETAIPLGCAWPPQSPASLKERIAMLKQSLPSRAQRLVGISTIALATFAACAAAWSAQPPRVVVTTAPRAETPEASAAMAEANAKEERALARIAMRTTQTVDLRGGQSEATAPTPPNEPSSMTPPNEPTPPTPRAEHDREDDNHEHLFSREERQAIEARGYLTPEEQARVQARVDRAVVRARTVEPMTPEMQAHIQEQVQHAMAEARTHQLTAEQQARLQERIARGLTEARTHELTAEQQERIHEQVRRAMVSQRDAQARARVAVRNVERTHEAVWATPEMRAELRELQAVSARLATAAQAASEASPAQRAEVERLRLDVQEHARRVGELVARAPIAAVAPRAEHDDDHDDDTPHAAPRAEPN